MAVIAAAAIGLLTAERFWPYNDGQRFLRNGFLTDFVWYNLIQSYVLGVVIGRLIDWIDSGTGLSRLKLLTDWPLPLQVSLFLVTHDLYIYWFHRLQHRSVFLWRFHEAHHSVQQVDWLSGVRSHPVEILVNQTIEFAPIVLLGASPEVPVIKGAISAIWGMYIHSNLDVRMRGLQYVLNGPEMHRWHHADEPEAYGKNFATKLAIWDWMFGTACFPDRNVKKASRYGLGAADFPEGGFWDGYVRQTLRALRAVPQPGGSSSAAAAITPGSQVT
jgi:sterol desaturase/sphingolipid hydroxylase (fatty acid hydroxylase superfamily)